MVRYICLVNKICERNICTLATGMDNFVDFEQRTYDLDALVMQQVLESRILFKGANMASGSSES